MALPTFGLNDIDISEDANVHFNSYINISDCYNYPPGYTYEDDGQTFFTGSKHFQADKVEVFQGEMKSCDDIEVVPLSSSR